MNQPAEQVNPETKVSPLEVLRQAQAGLDYERRKRFESYFIGAVSTLLNDEDWADAIDTAQRCMASEGVR